MKTLSELFSKFYKVRPTDGEVGIEIETETLAVGDYPKDFFMNQEDPQTFQHYWKFPMKYWIGHKDGSLRNFGVEFVLEKPLAFSEVPEALKEFKEVTKPVKFIPAPPSTSVHVHLNFSKKTLVEIGNFLTLWVLFENILVEFCGETRRSNLFALPCRVAEGISGLVTGMFKDIDEGIWQGLGCDPSSSKYGAVNVATLSTFGSIELRCFRGTTDADEIQSWVNILEELYKFASLPGLTPPDIIQGFRNSELEFFHNVFPKNGHRLADGLNLIGYIERNLWYAVDIAHSVADWNSIGDKIPANKTSAKKKKFEGISFNDDLEQMYATTNTPPPPDQPVTAGAFLDEPGNFAHPPVNWQNLVQAEAVLTINNHVWETDTVVVDFIEEDDE